MEEINQIFQKCFKKIRITGKANIKDETIVYMKMKTQLKIELMNIENKNDKEVIENQLRILENYLSIKCADKNRRLVNEYSSQLDSLKGTFSQNGLWQLKSKLCQKSVEPPMAKVDSTGQIITSPNLLKSLYLHTYSERLSHRVMKSEHQDIF